jgi:hypothetical protein
MFGQYPREKKRGLALGHITTEQPATDPAEQSRLTGGRAFGIFFKVWIYFHVNKSLSDDSLTRSRQLEF